MICRAHEDAILLQQPILLVAEQQPPLVEEGDIVAQLLQVAQNVGGDQDGVVLLPGELVEDLQHLVPDDGVQAGSGLVQHQQPGAVAQGHGDGQLHLHATGEVLEGLFLRQAEAGEVILVLLSVPTAVGLGHDASHLKGIQALWEIGLVQHHADVLFQGEKLRRGGIRPQDGAGAAVRPQGPHQQADGGGLAGAILSHQTADGAAGHGEGQVL